VNKYAALGLLVEAAKGRKVALISRTHEQARHAMYDFEVPTADGWRVRRANRDERIDTPAGGVIRFLSIRQSLRGTTHDVIFLDVDVDREMTIDNYDDLRHALRGADGEIIRA
jgi:hypothetical protein